MSLGNREDRLREEVVELRDEIRRLTIRVDRQADTISHLSALSEAGSLSQSAIGPRTEEHSLCSEESSRIAEAEIRSEAERAAEHSRADLRGVPESSLGSYSIVTGSRPAPEPAVGGGYSWTHREEVAREIGSFLARSLAGERRGSSGRERISRLQSRYYILVRDHSGLVTTQPVRVYSNFSAVKRLCAIGSNYGDSIFIGVPTLREGRLSVETAGFDWPTEILR